jgi:hypothetical protein
MCNNNSNLPQMKQREKENLYLLEQSTKTWWAESPPASGMTAATALITAKDAFFVVLFATFFTVGFFGCRFGTNILTASLTGEVDGAPATRAGTTAPTGTTCVPIRLCFTPPATEAGRATGFVAVAGSATRDPTAVGGADLVGAGCAATDGGLGAAMPAHGGAQKGQNGREGGD